METVLEPEWVGTRGRRGGFVACGEYVMVPPGLVTAMCVFPFISSETCHIMGLNTGYINSGIETKQKAQTTAEVIRLMWICIQMLAQLKKKHIRPLRMEKKSFGASTV